MLLLTIKLGTVPLPRFTIRKCDYTGTQLMGKKGKQQMHFAEYKNLPTEGWGRIKKYSHEWYSDERKSVSVLNFHDKRHIVLVSTVHHGSKLSNTERTRSGKREVVQIPKMVKDYSFKKVGVDVGDQKLRSQLSYADSIRSMAWSRKWGMYGIQQIRHNSCMCWIDIHELKDRTEPQCTKWSLDGCGGGKIQWAYQIGLTKGLLARIRQFKHVYDMTGRNKERFYSEEDLTNQHTIVDRGDEYRNVSCAVCLDLKKTKKSNNIKPCPTKFWCPHTNCRAHACKDHRADIHIYTANGNKLSKYHNLQRVEFTLEAIQGVTRDQETQVDKYRKISVN